MDALMRGTDGPVVNPYWPYDLSRPPGEPSPLRYLAWDQHARVDARTGAASRGAVRSAPSDQGDPVMQATVTAGLEPTQLASLMSLLEQAEVSLGAFTEEELAAVDPPADPPLVPLPLLELAPSEAERDQLLSAALRSLVARGLIEFGDEPGDLRATGVLSTVLALRGSPNSLLIVERVTEDDPARVVVYGFPLPGGGPTLFMAETVAELGHHEFVLRSAEGQAAALATFVGPQPTDSPAADLDAALEALQGSTRLYALRRDDDGTGESEFSVLELTLADGGEHGRWMVLFQSADDGIEGMLAVPVARLDLAAFFAGLLQLDLGPFNAALAAG
jgi:hypothetical protein